VSRITSLLTAAALLVHLLAGCCWHHAHTAQAAEVELQSTCCHRHAAPSSSDHEPAPSPEGKTCDETRCVTIPAVMVAVSPPWHLPVLVCSGDATSPLAVFFDSACLPAQAIELRAGPPLTPVELHQLLRV
jgi:hypothetical protein